MIIVLRTNATKRQVKHIVDKIKSMELKPWISKGKERSIIGVIGGEDALRLQPLEAYPGVEKVMTILKPYKLVSREFRKKNTVINLGNGVKIGGREIVVMGPLLEAEASLVHQGFWGD